MGFLGDDDSGVALIAGFASSLLADFALRVAPKSTITARTASRLPVNAASVLSDEISFRALRLNAVTARYADWWQSSWKEIFARQSWTKDREASVALGDVSRVWDSMTPLRLAIDRRAAQIEIDALVALTFGVSPEELCTIYRTQFPVLYGYDRREYLYDSNGRLVPSTVQQSWRKKGDAITEAERTATNASGNTYTYELPFVNLDREADMRQAYAHFEKLLEERS